MEWSEEIIAYLAVTDYQKLIPFLMAPTSSKNIIEKHVMFNGILSDRMEEIKLKTNDLVKKQIEQKFRPKTRFKN